MKILTLDQFLECKAGTLYQEYRIDPKAGDQFVEDFHILGRLTVKGVKDPEHPLLGGRADMPIKFHELGIPKNRHYEGLVAGQSVPYHVPIAGSEFSTTVYDSEQMFAVWEPSELRALNVLINQCTRAAASEPVLVSVDEPEDKKTAWGVDEWLNSSTSDCVSDKTLAYVHFFFTLHRFRAVERLIHHPFTQQFKLFADFEGVTWRITGASRLGDIYLSANPKREVGYDRRVTLDFAKITNWRAELDGTETMATAPKPLARRKELQAAPEQKTTGRHYQKIGKVHIAPGIGTSVSDLKQVSLPEGQHDIYIRTK